MTERDNFNLAKFIRNNQLLNESFDGFGGYMDLKPLKEEDVDNQANYYAEAIGDLYYVDLDSANFEDKSFQADLRANKIKTKIIDPEGPAGYAPVVRYMASKQTLADMITKHWATDPETASEWFDEIQPMNEDEDLGGWDGDGNPEHDQYDGEYDGETGPAITSEASKGRIDSSGMGSTKAAKAIGKWAESKGLSQDDFDELDMLLFDWFEERTDENDAGSDW